MPAYRTYHLRIWTTLLLVLGASGISAQITLDGTLGRSGTLSGPNFQITSDLGQQRGGNLFHSFGQFNIHMGQSATFSGPTSVNNIIGRVTGGETSHIDGTLRSTIQGANLYFLNPAGIVFGENARLNVKGSFHVSTADYLRLGDTGRFDARTPANSVLSVAPPSAFGFLGQKPASIEVQSGQYDLSSDNFEDGLRVPLGQTLSLVAGDLVISGGVIIASKGNIQLRSIASPGEVGMLSLESAGDALLPGGQTTIVGSSLLGASGESGGRIVISGGQLELRESVIRANTYGDGAGRGIEISMAERLTLDGGRISTETSGRGRAGNVSLSAGHLNMVGGHIDTNSASKDGPLPMLGDAGNITVRTGEFSFTEGTRISSTTQGGGKGGTITINATEKGSIITSGLFSDAKSSGPGGHIIISAPVLEMWGGHLRATVGHDAAQESRGGDIDVTVTNTLSLGQDGSKDPSRFSVETLGKAPAGNIFISAGHLNMIGGLMEANSAAELNDKSAAGPAGNITVQAGHISLSGGSRLSSTTQGGGQGGIITAHATEEILLKGKGPDPDDKKGQMIASGFFTDAKGSGAGGLIQVSTPRLTIQGGAIGATAGPGATKKSRGGSIELQVNDTLQLGRDNDGNNGGISVETFGEAPGGSISIGAGNLTLAGGHIDASSAFKDGSPATLGDAGNITVRAGRISLTDGGRMSSITQGSGKGGAITVDATESIFIKGSDEDEGVPSGLFTDAKGSGVGGKIFVSAPTLEFQGGAIGSNAFDKASKESRGGDIEVRVSDMLRLGRDGNKGGSGISVETFGEAPGGNISIWAGNLTLAGGRIDASSVFTDGSPATLGDAGNITVRAGRISLTDGGRMSSITQGMGKGGAITVDATESIFIKGSDEDEGVPSGLFTDAKGSGIGGSIGLTANSITLANNATVSSQSTGTGNAGNIRIAAYDRFRGQNSSVTTAASQSAGGNIEMSAKTLRLLNTPINASVAAGEGGGGNVTLTAFSIVALDNSDITAKANQGFGGNITINAKVFLRDPDVALDASSQIFGNEGTVEINAPDLDLSRVLAALPIAYLDATRQLSQRCVMAEMENRSSFLIRGQSMRPGPDDLLATAVSPCRPPTVDQSAGPSSPPSVPSPSLSLPGGDTWEQFR